MWRNSGDGLLCCTCFEKKKEEEKNEQVQKLKDEEAQVKAEQVDQPKPLKIPLRKSTRMARNYKTRSNPYALPKPLVGRGRGRRGVARRAPLRAPVESRSWMKTNRAYLLEGYLRVGDVVSLYGADDVVYYAQLRGFVCDLYGEKMGVVTWLLPTNDHKTGGFVPEHFYVGPDEDTPRRLDTMELEYRLPAGCLRFCKPPTHTVENFFREPVQIA